MVFEVRIADFKSGPMVRIMDNEFQLIDSIKDLLSEVFNFVLPSSNIVALMCDLRTSLKDEVAYGEENFLLGNGELTAYSGESNDGGCC